MKNTIKWFGNLNRSHQRWAKALCVSSVPLLIIILVAVIGFSMAACSNGSTNRPGPLDGTWVKDDSAWRFIFNGSNFILEKDNGGWENNRIGTFIYNETPPSVFTVTETWNGSEWEPSSDIFHPSVELLDASTLQFYGLGVDGTYLK